MAIIFFLLLTCTGLLLNSAGQVTESVLDCETIPQNIFIFAGQSNMAGRGGVNGSIWDHVVPSQCQSDPSILRLNGDLKWEVAVEPIHQGFDGKNKTVGIGPGMPFAHSLLENKPSLRKVGLVPCARGGSNINQWARGTFLYNRLVERANASAVMASQCGGKVQALLWYQGESDCKDLDDAMAYKRRLEQFFKNLREDLEGVSPDLPIMEVELASGENCVYKCYIDIVRDAQLKVAHDFDNLATVDANGLEVQPRDKLHLTTAAQVQLGGKLAKEFLSHNFTSDGP